MRSRPVHSLNMPVPRLALASVAQATSEKRPSTSGGTMMGGFLERTDPASLSPQMLQLRCSTRGSPRVGLGGGARGGMAGTTPAFIETLSRQKRAEQEQQEQEVRGAAVEGDLFTMTSPQHSRATCAVRRDAIRPHPERTSSRLSPSPTRGSRRWGTNRRRRPKRRDRGCERMRLASSVSCEPRYTQRSPC